NSGPAGRGLQGPGRLPLPDRQLRLRGLGNGSRRRSGRGWAPIAGGCRGPLHELPSNRGLDADHHDNLLVVSPDRVRQSACSRCASRYDPASPVRARAGPRARVDPPIGAVSVKLDTAPPRGMKDLLPPEVELRDQASATILSTYKRYGFRRVETPALENLKLLLGSGGGENEKLIYKVLKRGAKLDAATHGEDDLA